MKYEKRYRKAMKRHNSFRQNSSFNPQSSAVPGHSRCQPSPNMPHPLPKRPCLVWSGAWSPRHRSAWAQYYQRYGRRAEVTQLVPSLCCNLYTPKVTAGARACRSGWIKGRMPIWLFGPLETRLQEAQMVTREADGVGFMATRFFKEFGDEKLFHSRAVSYGLEKPVPEWHQVTMIAGQNHPKSIGPSYHRVLRSRGRSHLVQLTSSSVALLEFGALLLSDSFISPLRSQAFDKVDGLCGLSEV